MNVNILLVLALYLHIVYSFEPSVVVQTKYGKVGGYTSSAHKTWKGIPFAAPPLNNLRFKPPQSPVPWSSVLNATNFGPVCYGGGNGESEDCLYLNVWVPLNVTSDKQLPVIVWLYGGGFIGGSATGCPGDFLSGNDTIVVTLNYRLGTLGFLYHPALMDEENPTSGFYGLQDQRFAFQWVQDNIAAFGGDPSEVTIAGESAGAISVCVHLAAKRSAGLFSRAIMESGFCTLRPVNQSNVVATQILSALSCTGTNQEILACLLIKNASEVMAAPGNIPSFMPTLDPYELDAQPSVILSSERNSWNSVPVIAGVNHDENSMWICPEYSTITDEEYRDTLTEMYGSTYAGLIYQLYPPSSFSSPVRALIDATSDVCWKCPTKKLASQVTDAGKESFVYSFNVQQSDPCKGAQHSDELAYVFYGVDSPNYAKNLSTIMRSAWTSFARTTSPSTSFPGLEWYAFNTTAQYYMEFNFTSQLGDMFRQEECEFWEKVQASPQFQNIDLQEHTLCYFQGCYY
eukprot:Phypoly_transcript_04116.p1 GENE.Phypoly_transcript_04116~~Phypoly_transcript_04116.p1  ORF type:complete len:515 (+),score=72.42 Phypoly_transcript_04116:2-1546(+)